MKTKLKIIISVVSVVAAVTTAVVLFIVLRQPACGECRCGTSCGSNPKCRGTQCDNPDAVCTDGVCVVNHTCTPTGECVPDPSGPFKGNTCTCFSPSADNTCTPVGNSGRFTSKSTCGARDSDFECVPGTGTCERVLGSTTGWRTPDECKCFKCVDLTCVPAPDTHPSNIDGVTCGECGMWKCEGGECVQTETGGLWKDSRYCRCGLCVDGGCVPTSSGGAYPSVSACESDGAKMCQEPALGWGCNRMAGNPKSCVQTPGGSFPSLDECSCWTCAGTPPGPGSECVFNPRGGEYSTHQECVHDDTEKCGWKYLCQV